MTLDLILLQMKMQDFRNGRLNVLFVTQKRSITASILSTYVSLVCTFLIISFNCWTFIQIRVRFNLCAVMLSDKFSKM